MSIGAKIIVAATLESTIGPTTELIRDAAIKAGKEVELIEVLCGKAWACFETGNQGEVIVLAQASMAGAAALCTDLPKSVLSSPSFGVATAVAAFRQQYSHHHQILGLY